MELWYCSACHQELEREELSREREPHGEWLLWSPCCHEAPIPEDEYDPTPYCHICGAMSKASCSCGPIARNH